MGSIPDIFYDFFLFDTQSSFIYIFIIIINFKAKD